MELRQLAYVVAVAETGGFTRAARRCFVVQSALSHQVARLEKELGTRLFDRGGRGVRLTAAGEAFLGPAREALAAADRARGEAAARGDEVRGRLDLGAIATLTAVDLPELLAAYRERYPRVHVTLRGGLVRELLDGVRGHAYDLVFVDTARGAPPHGLNCRDLAHEELVAVVPAGHPLAAADRVSPARLAEEEMVDMPPGSGLRRHTDAAFAAAGAARTVTFEADTTALLERLVARGLGVALVSAAARRADGVCTVPVTGVPRRTVRAVWRRSALSPTARAFLRLLPPAPAPPAPA